MPRRPSKKIHIQIWVGEEMFDLDPSYYQVAFEYDDETDEEPFVEITLRGHMSKRPEESLLDALRGLNGL